MGEMQKMLCIFPPQKGIEVASMLNWVLMGQIFYSMHDIIY